VEAPVVAGVTFSRDEAQITVTGLPDTPGTVYSILKPVSDAGIEIDMIVLATSRSGSTDLSFTVNRDDYTQVFRLVQTAARAHSGCFVVGNDRVAKLSVVGVGMRSHAGVATQLFGALANAGVPMHLVSTSEIKISVLVPEEHLESCVAKAHKAFGLARPAAG
jgi:aspartate kinase